MPEVVYYVAASLDGYIATPDGGIAWLAPFEAAGEDYGYPAFYASLDALLLGSRTYEQTLTFDPWPYSGKPCWVFSRRALAPARPEVTVTARSPRVVVAELEARGIRRAWLVGGGQLAAAFRAEALITEYIVAIIPVILGAGIPLFGAPAADLRGLQKTSKVSTSGETLRLAEHKVYPDGVVQLRYLPGGDNPGIPRSAQVPVAVREFWQSYLDSLPDHDPARSRPIPPAWGFGDGPVMADELGRLVFQGTKTATCSSLWEMEHDGEPIPQAGDLSIILDGQGQPLCLIETAEVEVKPFHAVDARFAYDEGEGDRSLAFWRAAHWRFFSRTGVASGRAPDETMPIVCERFRVLWWAPEVRKTTKP
jgi:uncharacterized protein YhfF/dihydrofolate reductase